MLFGKRKIIEEQAKELAELKKQLETAQERNSSLEEELKDLKSKESAIAKAITDANLTAENILAQAKEESGKSKEKAAQELAEAENASNSMRSSAEETANRILSEAEEKASKVVSDANETGERLISEAEEKSQGILSEAQQQSQLRLQETEDEVRSYAEVLVKLNENMKEQAKLAQEASERYAAFYKQMSLSLPGIMNSLTGAQLQEGEQTDSSGDKGTNNDDSLTTVSDILLNEADNVSASTEDILNNIL